MAPLGGPSQTDSAPSPNRTYGSFSGGVVGGGGVGTNNDDDAYSSHPTNTDEEEGGGGDDHHHHDAIPSSSSDRQQHQPLLDRNGSSSSSTTKVTDSTNNKCHPSKNDDDNDNKTTLHPFVIASILSTSFAYGCIMSTLFLLTLPLECERIQIQHPQISKSIALSIFVAIAGITQLVSPLVGMLSDTYRPPLLHGSEVKMGRRLPYLILGTTLTVLGLLGQSVSSTYGVWIRYGLSFFTHMIGLNITYAIMIALIPDLVPQHQTGVANGILALLIVCGSLFGFGLFHSVLGGKVHSMYGLYVVIVIVSGILTCWFGNGGDVGNAKRMESKRRRREERRLGLLKGVDGRNDTTTDGDEDDEDTADEGAAEEEDEEGSSTTTTSKNTTTKTKSKKRRRRRIVHPPGLFTLLRTMLYEPLTSMSFQQLTSAYTIDTIKYHDFYIVTISRTFYYMGISVQTFFLYFVHDVIGITDNPEDVVALLAIVGQMAGAVTCYPIGVISDKCASGRRKPFVYISCFILAIGEIALLWCRTMDAMFVVCSILGGANGMYLTMDTSLAVDTLPSELGDENQKEKRKDEEEDIKDDEEREAENSGSAQLLGIWGVAGFLGSALGPLIGGPLLYVFGSVVGGGTNGTTSSSSDGTTTNDEDGEEEGGASYSLLGYAVLLGMSAFYFCCSALVLRFVRAKGV